MPYREKKIYSGDYLEVGIYNVSYQDRKETRREKEKLTVPKQRNLNHKNAVRHLIRLTNTNFTDRDLAIHLTYEDKYLPKTEEESKRHVNNYLRRIRYYREKNNLPSLKYIAVVEYKEPKENNKGVRIHHHVIINEMDRDIAEELWGMGRANTKKLKADEYGYEGLARYISKDPKGKRRWSQSRNLDGPDVKVNDYRFSNRKVDEISKYPEDRQLFAKLYPGYILNDCKVIVNDYTGKKQLYIRMRKLKT